MLDQIGHNVFISNEVFLDAVELFDEVIKGPGRTTRCVRTSYTRTGVYWGGRSNDWWWEGNGHGSSQDDWGKMHNEFGRWSGPENIKRIESLINRPREKNMYTKVGCQAGCASYVTVFSMSFFECNDILIYVQYSDINSIRIHDQWVISTIIAIAYQVTILILVCSNSTK